MSALNILVGEQTAMLPILAIGIMFCSLICVVGALRNEGKMFEKIYVMLFCQFYILSIAMIQLTTAMGSVVQQVIGFVLLALGVAPIVVKKASFQAARYCIVLGGLLAVVAIFVI